MSSPPQFENGAYGAHVANGATGAYDPYGVYPVTEGPQGPPSVYHPQAEPPPPYEQYVDPAAAHGWQNAYDETQQLPPVDPAYAQQPYAAPAPQYAGHSAQHADHLAPPDPAPGPEGHPEPVAEDDYDYRYEDGRPVPVDDDSVFVDGSGRRGRLVRRVAIGAGAGCVLFLGAVFAGMFDSGPSGSPLPWVQNDVDPGTPGGGPAETASPSAGDSATAQPSAGEPSSGSTFADRSPSPSTTPSAPAGGSSSTARPTAAPSTTAAPTTTEPARGNAGDNPGRGQGATKGPK
ncbi:hypothetical protein [Streptomyces griseosporeus]|uniref:hypothetical protein n=1 Tax=Streptomyces griseosporeus TaxID=1910 RepID=UPI0036FB61E0